MTLYTLSIFWRFFFLRTYSTSPSPHNSPLVSFGAPVEVRRLLIRTDVHCDVESNTMTVMLELPGVKKADLSLSLGTCPYSRVRQLTVRGRSGPTFTDEGYTVRERKYGEFKRVLVVPPETKVRRSYSHNSPLNNGLNGAAKRHNSEHGRRDPQPQISSSGTGS